MRCVPGRQGGGTREDASRCPHHSTRISGRSGADLLHDVCFNFLTPLAFYVVVVVVVVVAAAAAAAGGGAGGGGRRTRTRRDNT